MLNTGTMNLDDKSLTHHHFLPRFYLEYFSDNGKVDVVNRINGTARIKQKCNKVARAKGLYTFKDKRGELNGILENEIEKNVEGPASRVFSMLNSDTPKIPTDTDRFFMAQFIALQTRRTPESIRESELLYDFMMKADLQVKRHDDPVMKEFVDNIHNYEILPPRAMVLLQMLELMPIITELLMQRRWQILTFSRPMLLTCDAPVILIGNDYSTNFLERSPGFKTAKEIYFPLACNRLLVMRTSQYPEHVISGEPMQAVKMNKLIQDSSYQEIYRHPDLSNIYDSMSLGERPIMQIEGGPFNEEFMKPYNEAPVRKHPTRSRKTK